MKYARNPLSIAIAIAKPAAAAHPMDDFVFPIAPGLTHRVMDNATRDWTTHTHNRLFVEPEASKGEATTTQEP